MSKIIVVFGATGNQGGSVVQHILADPALAGEYRIRAVTRDSTKARAIELAGKGIEIVTADMLDAGSLADAVRGADTVFLATNFWETMSKAKEVAQGKAVADAAKNEGVKHLIFSSLLNTTATSNGRLPHIDHFVGKSEIEQYIRGLGVPATFFLPGTFMSSIKDMIRKQEDGTYLFPLPVGDNARLPLFDAAGDTGPSRTFVKAIIKHRSSLFGKRIYGAADYYPPSRIVREFSEVTGQAANFVAIPAETFKSYLPPAAAQEIYENMELLVDPGYYAGDSLDSSLALLDGPPTSWQRFLSQGAN